MQPILRYSVFVFFLVYVSNAYAQYNWRGTSSPVQSDRYEDIYFIHPDTGWAVEYRGQIVKTTDGGLTWSTTYQNTNGFLGFRDVSFFNARLGFIGTLTSNYLQGDTFHLFKTTNGGNTITPVRLPGPKEAGICGLRRINDSTIYACGRYFGPPAFYKSTNKGTNWSYKDMSAYAGGLIDILFLSADTGFAAGTLGSYNESTARFDSSGILLYTTDGGDTWVRKARTSGDHEGCWKISFPSRNVGYVSIQGLTEANFGARNFLKTTDGGLTWQEINYSNDGYFQPQGIGFITDSIGWISGRNLGNTGIYSYKTTDGGNSWLPDTSIVRGNRFRFFGDTLGYVGGTKIYKLSAPCGWSRPVLSFSINDTLCLNASAVELNTGLPAGGIYAVDSTIASNFIPATAGIGNHVISYTIGTGQCSLSIKDTVTVDVCSGINDDISNIPAIKVYPQPVKDILHIVTVPGTKSIELLDINGRRLEQLGNNPSTYLDVSHYQPGVYLLLIKTSHNNFTVKVVKQ